MDINTRRPPLPKGRRINLNVNLSPATHKALGRICGGNRSAAIEILVENHFKRTAVPQPAPDAVT